MAEIYEKLLVDPTSNIYYESGRPVSEVYTKRNVYISKYIERGQNYHVLPEQIHELCVYSYLSYICKKENILWPNRPQFVAGIVAHNVSTIIVKRYTEDYSVDDYKCMTLVQLKRFIFQILVTCMIFNKIGLKHNDLRSENIVRCYMDEDDDDSDNSDEEKYEFYYQCYDENGQKTFYRIKTNLIYKVIDYEFSVIPKFIPYSIEHQTESIKNFHINKNSEPSADFFLFLTSLALKFHPTQYLYLNQPCYDYLSTIFTKFYQISLFDYLPTIKNRPHGPVLSQPLEPLLNEFSDFLIDSSDDLDCFYPSHPIF